MFDMVILLFTESSVSASMSISDFTSEKKKSFWLLLLLQKTEEKNNNFCSETNLLILARLTYYSWGCVVGLSC